MIVIFCEHTKKDEMSSTLRKKWEPHRF